MPRQVIRKTIPSEEDLRDAVLYLGEPLHELIKILDQYKDYMPRPFEEVFFDTQRDPIKICTWIDSLKIGLYYEFRVLKITIYAYMATIYIDCSGRTCSDPEIITPIPWTDYTHIAEVISKTLSNPVELVKDIYRRTYRIAIASASMAPEDPIFADFAEALVDLTTAIENTYYNIFGEPLVLDSEDQEIIDKWITVVEKLRKINKKVYDIAKQVKETRIKKSQITRQDHGDLSTEIYIIRESDDKTTFLITVKKQFPAGRMPILSITPGHVLHYTLHNIFTYTTPLEHPDIILEAINIAEKALEEIPETIEKLKETKGETQ